MSEKFKPYRLMELVDGAYWSEVSAHASPEGLKTACNGLRDDDPSIEYAWTYFNNWGSDCVLTGVHLRKSDPRHGPTAKPTQGPCVFSGPPLCRK